MAFENWLVVKDMRGGRKVSLATCLTLDAKKLSALVQTFSAVELVLGRRADRASAPAHVYGSDNLCSPVRTFFLVYRSYVFNNHPIPRLESRLYTRKRLSVVLKSAVIGTTHSCDVDILRPTPQMRPL